MTPRRLVLVSLLLLTSPALEADVITVAQDGSGDFLHVSDAVSAASDGDLLLVAPGNYIGVFPLGPDTALSIENKTLTIVGDGPGVSLPQVFVRNLPASKLFVLRNANVGASQLAGIISAGITVEDCAGEVLLEDCTVTGRPGFSVAKAEPALEVSGASRVVASRSTFVGGLGPDTDPLMPFLATVAEGGDAVVVHAGHVVLYHCTAIGGRGSDDPNFDLGGRPGGAGVVVEAGGQLRLYGSDAAGGAGGSPCPASEPAQCVGGDGAVITDALLHSVGATFTGGPGGLLDDQTPAPDGTPLVLAGGAVHLAHPDLVPDLHGPVAPREGTFMQLTISGEPGTGARLFLALDTTFAPLSGKKGVFVPGMPTLGPIVIGTLPASGELDAAFVVPALPVGVEHVLSSWQGYTTDGAGFLLTSPLQVELVDASF
ncbi:MAG: hypothetical protein H6825_00505 [Planctomycetes bacterium]|nr:hypothetical protein [Planctomycetota bacterium]